MAEIEIGDHRIDTFASANPERIAINLQSMRGLSRAGRQDRRVTGNIRLRFSCFTALHHPFPEHSRIGP